MSDQAALQRRMDDAFDNYLALSDILREDFTELLDSNSDSPASKRNLIRTAVALIEGLTNNIREMCIIGLECGVTGLSKKEILAVTCENYADAGERYKLTVRAGYKVTSLSPLPDFSDAGWSRAQNVFKKRNLLMHPKQARDLEIEASWSEITDDITWLIQPLFDFIQLLQQQHSGKAAKN